jgi:hypothetical protein
MLRRWKDADRRRKFRTPRRVPSSQFDYYRLCQARHTRRRLEWRGRGRAGRQLDRQGRNLSLDFGSIAHVYPAALATNLADPNVHISTRVRDNIFRVGLNYHFASGLPVVTASY